MYSKDAKKITSIIKMLIEVDAAFSKNELLSESKARSFIIMAIEQLYWLLESPPDYSDSDSDSEFDKAFSKFLNNI